MKRTLKIAAITMLAVAPFLTGCGSSGSEAPDPPNPASVDVKNSGWSDGTAYGSKGAIYSQQFTRTYDGGRERLCTVYVRYESDTQMIDCVWADEAILEKPAPR